MSDERIGSRSSIITGGVVTVALGAVTLAGAHYFLTPTAIPKPQECQHIRMGEGEELGDVVKRMRVYDSGITVEKLARQNNLFAEGKILNVVGGAELKYCYNK
jgi:hypothetical protein